MEKRPINRSFYLVGGVVIILLLFYMLSPEENVNNGSEELKLAAVLSEMDGVGQVQVYFHYDQEETTGQFLAVSQKQQMEGVIIVAQGAHDLKVKRLLQQTVGDVLQIPRHRIQIVPMQTKEE